jgi:hypothetical protein
MPGLRRGAREVTLPVFDNVFYEITALLLLAAVAAGDRNGGRHF